MNKVMNKKIIGQLIYKNVYVYGVALSTNIGVWLKHELTPSLYKIWGKFMLEQHTDLCLKAQPYI